MSEQRNNAMRQLNVGDEFNQLRVVEQIAFGGASVVYKAFDAVLDRHVAIKQLLPDHDDEVFRQRFRQEAELQRRISEKHPGLVRLFDVVDDQRGIFLIMEYVEGRTLEAALAKTGDPLDPLGALRLIYAVADVLDTIHTAGVIHRDLKPANIILPTPAPGHVGQPVKICDLGLATVMAEQEALSLGSVRYMAPELFDPKAAATGQADLYALGMIGYEMLIGRRAFDQTFRTILRDQRSQAMRWMKWHTNVRLKVTPAAELNPKVPLTVSELIGRLLEKEQVKRVASARELKDAIQRHFGRRPGSPTPGSSAPGSGGSSGNKASGGGGDLMAAGTGQAFSSPGATATLPRRTNWLIWGAAAAILVAVVAGGWLLVDSIQQQAAQSERLAQGRTLLKEADDAYQQGDLVTARNRYLFVVNDWNDNPAMRSRAQAGLLLVDIKRQLESSQLEEASATLDELEKSGTQDQVTIRAMRREIDMRRKFREQIASIERALEQGRLGPARVIIDEYTRAELSQEERRQLDALTDRLRLAVAQQQVDRQMADVEALVQADRRADAVAKLHELAQHASDPRIEQRLDELETQAQYESLIAQAQASRDAGDLTAAIATYRQAANLRPDPKLDQLIRQLRLADVLSRADARMQQNDFRGARFLYLEASDLDPDNAEAKRNLAQLETSDQWRERVQAGDAALHLEQFETAVNHYEAALKLRADDDVSAKLTQARVQMLVHQARTEEANNRLAKARELYAQALALQPDIEEATQATARLDTHLHYDDLLAQGDKARLKGDYSQAVALYRQARDVLRTEAVQARLNSIEFEQLIARARGMMETKRYDAAWNLLRTAAGLPGANPQVVKQLHDQLTELDPKSRNRS